MSWLVASVVGLTALFLAAAHVPARLRLLGLFAVGCGLAAGWLTAKAAAELGTRTGRGHVATVFVLTLAGLVASTLEAHRLDVAAELRRLENNPEHRFVLRIVRDESVPEEMAAAFADEAKRLRRALAFPKYLQGRLKNLDRDREIWPTGLPAALWGAELLLGSLAAVWIFRKTTDPARETPT